MGETQTVRLHNTLTRTKEVFTPIDPNNVRMYVCGPTVYDYAHIGNARPVIVFDLLFRLLRHLYGADHVTYARNITDVDDKINARAVRDFPGLALNEAIRRVTETTAAQYQNDARALGALEPTVQPRATDNIPQMQALISTLIGSRHAYEAAGEVLFAVDSMPDYGKLSGRNLEDNVAGARVAVEAHKRNPADFVLWKQSSPDEPGWDSPWGRGRPGWHIECSAMSERYLGQVFDIHAGGLDLIFPHHENEIAQSRCAHGTPVMANYWLHNGFLQVEGQKMSKSLGNFITIHELLAGVTSRPYPGEVIRLTMLATHYRQPIDFTYAKLDYWRQKLSDWVGTFKACGAQEFDHQLYIGQAELYPTDGVWKPLADDLNFSGAVAELDELAKKAPNSPAAADDLGRNLLWLGLMRNYASAAYYPASAHSVRADLISKYRDCIEDARALALNFFDWSSSRSERENSLQVLNAQIAKRFPKMADDGVAIRVGEHFDVSLEPLGDTARFDEQAVLSAVNSRLAALNARDFATADTIRADLLTQGVQLMDYKDEAGKRATKWEVKR